MSRKLGQVNFVSIKKPDDLKKKQKNNGGIKDNSIPNV